MGYFFELSFVRVIWSLVLELGVGKQIIFLEVSGKLRLLFYLQEKGRFGGRVCGRKIKVVNSFQFLLEEKECLKFCVFIFFKIQLEYILSIMFFFGLNVNSVFNRFMRKKEFFFIVYGDFLYQEFMDF